MFQAREPHESLWQSEFLITPRKAKLMRRSWAEVFRNEALALIEGERFAPMYSPDMGRPNRAVQTVLGVLVLKEMFDLTDMEALEFNPLWHHALRLEMEEAHLAQKTLHNFRVRLMEHDGGRLAFCETTDRMIEALGLRTGKQRLDSTHVMSNTAVLTRLGLFCETVRVFLLAVSREHPGLGEGIGDGLAQRYLKETGEASRYEDARSGEGRRRLVDRFRGTAVAKMEEYGLLERLLHEQCHMGRHRDGRPGADDDDAEEGKVPVALREPKEVRSSSMQTPHDPAVTYSGHKGKGYEVQVSETCEEGNAVQMITHVEVTPSSGSDAGVTVGVIDTLRERGIGPSALWCDTSYGSGHNGWEAERRGTELVSPVGGRVSAEADRGDGPVRLTAADFDIDVTARRAAVCPAGHEAVSEYEDEEAPERVEMHFAREVCGSCKLRSRCPVRWRRRPELGGEWSPSGAYVLSADLARVNIGRRRRAESDGQWRRRYGLRAGIVGYELGVETAPWSWPPTGTWRREGPYLKALACNVKRMVRARLDEMLALPAALATAPTAA